MKKIVVFLFLVLGFSFMGCSSSNAKVSKIIFTKPVVHFLGLLPGANCKMQYQLDLFENNTYYMRTTCLKNGVASKSNDDIGRWHLDDNARLTLRGGREAPVFFELFDSNSMGLLTPDGTTIKSNLNYTLTASNTAKTLEPDLFMMGMYSYMADAAIFKECLTALNLPVAFEEESLALERAYLKTKKIAGEKIKVHLRAKIVLRKGMDSSIKKPTLLVKKFIKIIPKEVCQHLGSKANLLHTYWKLTVLNDMPVAKTQRREAYFILSDGRVKGNSGCNGLGANYVLDAENLTFSDKGFAMTRMFCKGSVENEFLKALKKVVRYELKGEYLELFDKKGVQLARFESVYLN